MSFRDKQTLTIISINLANNLSDVDTMPRLDTELVRIDNRDLQILKQILPENEVVKKILSRPNMTHTDPFKTAVVVEVKALLTELDAIRKGD